MIFCPHNNKRRFFLLPHLGGVGVRKYEGGGGGGQAVKPTHKNNKKKFRKNINFQKMKAKINLDD